MGKRGERERVTYIVGNKADDSNEKPLVRGSRRTQNSFIDRAQCLRMQS